MNGIFRLVEKDLQEQNYVLFSGTPCQVAGLNAFLNLKGISRNGHLLTLEVICHGVGSVRFLEDYIHHLEETYNSKARSMTFRAKTRPGKKLNIAVFFSNGKQFASAATKYDWFYSAFLKNYILRPGCFSCRFAQKERFADISIADHWGDSQGELACRSLIVANTEMGYSLWNCASMNMIWQEILEDQVTQLHMVKPSEKPADYEVFWRNYLEEGYLAAQRYLVNHTVKGHIRDVCVRILYELHLRETVKLIRNFCRRLQNDKQ